MEGKTAKCFIEDSNTRRQDETGTTSISNLMVILSFFEEVADHLTELDSDLEPVFEDFILLRSFTVWAMDVRQ